LKILRKFLSSLFACFMIVALFSVLNVCAKTVWVAKFDLKKMEYFNEELNHWFIRKDTKPEEYLCVMNVSQMAANKDYSSCKAYSVNSDCDYWFDGFIQMTLPNWISQDEGKGSSMEFFACTKDGTVIYPTDGTAPTKKITLEDGQVKVSFGASNLKKGDTIYFVVSTDATYKSPYMTVVGTIFESPWGSKQREAYTDTNEFYGVQDKEGWSYCYIPKKSINFTSKQVADPTTVTTTSKEITTTTNSTTKFSTAETTENTTGTSESAVETTELTSTVTTSGTVPSDTKNVSPFKLGGIIAAIVVLIGAGACVFIVLQRRNAAIKENQSQTGKK